MDAREAFVALNMIELVGSIRVRKLLQHFGDAPSILSAPRAHLMRVQGIGPDVADNIVQWEQNVDLAGELRRIQESGCQIVIQDDPEYPPLLKEIYDPPVVLYVKGSLTLSGSFCCRCLA